MNKARHYVTRDVVHERLMANPMAMSYWNLSEDEQNRCLDEIMQKQNIEAVSFVSQLIASYLYRSVLSIPLKVRLRYTTCRIPMVPVTFFGASNLREFV